MIAFLHWGSIVRRLIHAGGQKMNPMLVTQRTQKAFQAAVAELLR